MGKEEGFRFQPGRRQLSSVQKIGSVRFESSYSWPFSTENDLTRFLTELPITRFRPIFATLVKKAGGEEKGKIIKRQNNFFNYFLLFI